MKVRELVNLRRKETPLYYRKEYSAEAVLEIMAETTNVPIEFVLEHRPIGGVDLRVNVLGELDYPLLPVIGVLKTYVSALHESGGLP